VTELEAVTVETADGRQETIRSTPEHPFYVDGHGWTAAQDLTGGQHLLMPDGSYATVAFRSVEPHPEGVTVYDFEVQDDHTYFASTAGQSDAMPLVRKRTLSLRRTAPALACGFAVQGPPNRKPPRRPIKPFSPHPHHPHHPPNGKIVQKLRGEIKSAGGDSDHHGGKCPCEPGRECGRCPARCRRGERPESRV
jgi:hypothetical protein